jgi:hypothetical protein
MNRLIFLLSTFLLLPMFAKKEAFNTETCGLKPEVAQRIKAELGPMGWKQLTKYLNAGNVNDIEEVVKNNEWKVWAFHRNFITVSSAADIAQMQACETCLTLGEIVKSSKYLQKTFSKINNAQTQLDRLHYLEKKTAQDEEAKRKLEKQLRDDYHALHEARLALLPTSYYSSKNKVSLSEKIIFFLKEIDSSILELPHPHPQTYCDDHATL